MHAHQGDVGGGGGCGDGLGGGGGVHGLDVRLERERRLERVGSLLQALERAEGRLHPGQQLVLLAGDQVRAGSLAQLLPDPAPEAFYFKILNLKIRNLNFGI